MNEYPAGPMIAIVIAALAITVSAVVFLKVASNKRKKRKEQERRRMELRVAQQLEKERQSAERRRRAVREKSKQLPIGSMNQDVYSRANLTNNPSRTVKLQDLVTGQAKQDRQQRMKPVSRSRSTTTYGESRRYDPGTDSLSGVAGGMMIGSWFDGNSAPDRSNDDNSSRDSGSSHSNDSGSTGSSGYGESSSGGGDFSGGSSSSDSGGSFSGGDSGSF